MRKILYVITQGEWGGAQRYVFDLATGLANEFDVTVAIGEKKGRNDLEERIRNYELGIRVIELKHLVRQISPVNDVLAVLELAKLYRTLKPDIVHLNSSKAGILGSLAKSLAKLDSRFHGNDKIKIIYTVHGWVFNEPNRKIGRWLYRFLEKSTARWKDKIIVLSKQDLLTSKQLGIPEEKLIEIPLGIETLKFLDREEARRFLDPRLPACRQARRGDDIMIGTIANLYKTKGLDVLIEAVKIQDTRYKIQDTKFIIIGEGPERKRLENLIKKYKLGNTVFLIGALNNAAQYLPAFNLFVLPSRKEGLPYTLLEAIASEVPIIATNVGGIPSLIEDKKGGLLIPPENPQDLSNALLYALNHLEEMKLMAKRIEKKKKQNLPEMLNQTTLLFSSQ